MKNRIAAGLKGYRVVSTCEKAYWQEIADKAKEAEKLRRESEQKLRKKSS